MVQTLYMASNAATLIATTLDGGAHGGHVGIIMLQALYSSVAPTSAFSPSSNYSPCTDGNGIVLMYIGPLVYLPYYVV
jgi:hypothetical protein